MIHVYGSEHNRAFRTFWMLEELGLPYEATRLDTQGGETRTPEFLSINPNGHVPTLIDGDATIWESMAINLYLARKYDGGLAPKSLEDEAAALQWSFWAITEVEGELLKYGMNKSFLPEDQRNPALVSEADEKLSKALGVLDAELSTNNYLAGDAFSVADLNVAAVLSWTALVQYDIAAYPNLSRWLTESLGRPAAKRLQQAGK